MPARRPRGGSPRAVRFPGMAGHAAAVRPRFTRWWGPCCAHGSQMRTNAAGAVIAARRQSRRMLPRRTKPRAQDRRVDGTYPSDLDVARRCCGNKTRGRTRTTAIGSSGTIVDNVTVLRRRSARRFVVVLSSSLTRRRLQQPTARMTTTRRRADRTGCRISSCPPASCA